jgi:hypothetical protein
MAFRKFVNAVRRNGVSLDKINQYIEKLPSKKMNFSRRMQAPLARRPLVDEMEGIGNFRTGGQIVHLQIPSSAKSHQNHEISAKAEP